MDEVAQKAMRDLERARVVPPQVNGAQVLDEVHSALTKYVAFPSLEAADAVTLFIAATHGQSVWEHATRLVIKSPLKRCGKTRLQECGAELCHRPLRTTNISSAALVRSINEDDPPTLVLDEGDVIFSKRRGERSEGAEDLRGVLNAGHSRGWPYVRWDAAARRSEECPTFAMAIVSGIGDFPDTIEDRAIIVKMRRRAPGEQVAQFRRKRAIPPLQELRERLHAWISGHLETLGNAEPDLPVEDRAADCWEPLAAVADLAGGDWPARVHRACIALSADVDPDDATAGERLLADLRDVFGDSDRLATATILDALHAIEEAPWADWYGHEFNARDLARLLRPYGIKSKNVRLAGAQAKGFERADFLDAWGRYLDASASRASQRPETLESPGEPRDGSGTEADSENRPAPDLGVDTPRDAGTADTAQVPKPCPDPWTFPGDIAPCVVCGTAARSLDNEGRRRHPACRMESVS
jgi:hypothetical protein